MVVLLFLYGVVLWSPITAALGMRWTYFLIAIGSVALALSVMHRRPIKVWFISIGAPFVLSTSITAIYWTEVRFLRFPLAFLVALFLLSQSTRREIEAFVDWASWFVLVLLAGAWIAFASGLVGIGPVFQFPRPAAEYQTIYVFATTLTNVYWNPLMRPAGIYDEPGALSFVVCLIAFMRNVLGRDYKITWLMLVLGFVTLSLAHLVFVSVFFLSERLTVRKMSFALLVGMLIAGALVFSSVRTAFSDRFVARLAITSAGSIVGDNRSDGMLRAWDILTNDKRVFYFGIDPVCTFDGDECESRYQSVGGNPLQDVTERGIFASWPYYLYLATAVFLALRARRNLPFLGVALLLLQRPFLFSFGYSLLALMALWLQLAVYPSRFADVRSRFRPPKGASPAVRPTSA